jgi:hypothetical protein
MPLCCKGVAGFKRQDNDYITMESDEAAGFKRARDLPGDTLSASARR